MKLLLFIAIFFSSAFAGSGFYNLRLKALNNGYIETSSYQGKKVIITIVDAENPDTTQLKYLDSVKRASSGVEVIGVLTEDFGKKAKLKEVKALTKTLQIELTEPVRVKKGAAEQDPLLQWLTSEKANEHFNIDVKSTGQLFLVSGKGTLYAVLIKETPKEVIGKILNQPFAQ